MVATAELTAIATYVRVHCIKVSLRWYFMKTTSWCFFLFSLVVYALCCKLECVCVLLDDDDEALKKGHEVVKEIKEVR